MKLAWIGGAIVLVAYGLHRLASWAEARGWIYYLKRRGSSGTLGDAFLEVQTMFDPSKKIVLEERRREVREEHDAGGPPRT
ncbi:MAG TPA: hypothetical protein VF139_04295 [Candidatus Polarisedimenticolaceae bacterium]